MQRDYENICATYRSQGFVVAREVFPREVILRLRAHAEDLIAQPGSALIQRSYDRSGNVKLIKINQLADYDEAFHRLSSSPVLVDLVELILGAGSRRFRDVLVVKPARTGGSLAYHQDSAYWDVEPMDLLSAWIALGDVDENASCLKVIPCSHTKLTQHGLYLRERYPVPEAAVALLRRLVTLAGSGDNPRRGGSMLAWRAKELVLARLTRYIPTLFDLQEYRIPVSATRDLAEHTLPVHAGDVVLFHSLLWHASGPNKTDSARHAEIVSFMSSRARFTGRGKAEFPTARGK